MENIATESNKFQGLRYCALSSNGKIIAVERNPDIAYHKAIIAGEHTETNTNG